MKHMNARQLSIRLHAAAAVIDAIVTFADNPIAYLNGDEAVIDTSTKRAKLHWTQRPSNRAKLRRLHQKMVRTKNAAKVKTIKNVKVKANLLHWTQRPSNRAKVLKMNRASAKKRLAAA